MSEYNNQQPYRENSKNKIKLEYKPELLYTIEKGKTGRICRRTCVIAPNFKCSCGK